MRHLTIRGLFCLAALTLLAVPVLAQRTTGEIIGRVTDASGAVLPGVTVTLHGAGVAGAPTAVTSENGLYRFPVLPPGLYDLDFTMQGFTTVRREGVQVAVGSTVELDVPMAVGALEETVTVTGESPVVSVSTSQVSTSYNKEWVQNAPLRRYSYFDLIMSAPGISQTSQLGSTSTATSLGSSTNENQYQIDGTDISATPWPNTDAVEEVEVLQLGASAEYGNVQGAVFNIVTRQGANALHGDANVYFQNDNLTSRNTTDAYDNGWPYHIADQHDATVQVSGPFIKDKFWFFGSLQTHRIYDSQPGVNPASPSKSDAKRVFWKFNYNITPNHRLLHGYHDDFYWIPGITTQFTAPSTITLSHGHNPTPNLVYTGVLSSNTVIEARYSGFWLQASDDPNEEGDPTIQTRYEDQDTGDITGGISSWGENRSWRWGVQGKVVRYVESFLGGSHDLKVGLQYHTHGASNLTGNNDTILTYSVTGRPSTGTTQLPFYRGTEASWWGTYIDDTYRFGDRTVVNLGLRYDYSVAGYPAFPFLDLQGNPTGEMSAANDHVYDYSVVSPRLGVNYKLFNSTIVKGHYGRYYSAIERDYAAIVPSTTTLLNFTVGPGGNRFDFTSTRPTDQRVDPNRKAPYSDQYMVQVEHELMTNLGLQVNYVHKRGTDFPGWEDTTGQYVQVPYVDNVGTDASGQTFMLWRLTSNASDRSFLLTTPLGPDGRGLYMRYHGATVMLTKRMSNNWQGVVSMVWSESTGRLSSSARTAPSAAQSSAAGTFAQTASGPNDWVNTDGRLLGDKPIVAKVQLVYQFPWGIMGAINAQHQTGRLWARQVRPAGLGFPAAPIVNMEANTGERRVEDVDLIDLRVQKEFRLGDSAMRLALFFDALNLTNSNHNENVASQLGTATTFGVPIRLYLPRRIQLGTKFRW
ncbi:MAG TPA: TonB-dependent receptor [Vicinamibacterales bacterium]|nr:TonB-dependent receptor [Vicinamibacterales bacterium]